MLKQEDRGYGTDQDPSGYVKIEVREDKGKMTIVVQNLREAPEKYGYRAIILKSDENEICFASIGDFEVQRNRGELQWEFNPSNVGLKGFSINEFSAVAILLDKKSNGDNILICPLVAYKDKKVAWKGKLTDILYNRASRDIENEGGTFEKKDVFSKYLGGLESKYIPEVKMPQRNNEIIVENQSKVEPKPEPEPENRFSNDTVDEPEYTTEEKSGDKGDRAKSIEEESPEINEKNVNTCNVKDKKACISQSNIRGYNPCANCYMSIDKKNAAPVDAGVVSIEKLKENLTKCFETCNPFGSKRRDYIWWKISNPVYLNNVLYQCNIRSPLLFNPRVMTAHFKYRHLIFGIYTDSIKRREYIVCGAPGVYNTNDRPFGDMCKWVQIEGNRPRQGAFGYWLAYVEPKSGKLLNIN